MPHIAVDEGLPGILSLFAFRPQSAGPLNALAETLLRGESTLSRGERELIAARVSRLNETEFCARSHSAFAAAQLDGGEALVATVVGGDTSVVSEKLRALLAIAGKVQRSGLDVSEHDVAIARGHGATDEEIHDAVLIAAAFCMYNRYVDGLATIAPEAPEAYREMAHRIVEHGYGTAPVPVPA
jgi:uncharacterized peroxidase-related enzyme